MGMNKKTFEDKSDLLNFLQHQFDNKDKDFRMDTFFPDVNDFNVKMESIYENSVINTWLSDGRLRDLYKKYPKYNFLNGATNGCKFLTTQEFIDMKNNQNYENLEKHFQECVYKSYFIEYKKYQDASRKSNEKGPYLGIWRKDNQGNYKAFFDVDDFKIIRQDITAKKKEIEKKFNDGFNYVKTTNGQVFTHKW